MPPTHTLAAARHNHECRTHAATTSPFLFTTLPSPRLATTRLAPHGATVEYLSLDCINTRALALLEVSEFFPPLLFLCASLSSPATSRPPPVQATALLRGTGLKLNVLPFLTNTAIPSALAHTCPEEAWSRSPAFTVNGLFERCTLHVRQVCRNMC